VRQSKSFLLNKLRKALKKKTEPLTAMPDLNAVPVAGNGTITSVPDKEIKQPGLADTAPIKPQAEEGTLSDSPQPKLKVSVSNGSLVAAASVIPNLKELNGEFTKAEEQKPDYVSGEKRNTFTEEALLKLWTDYAKQAKKSGKINLFTIMTANSPKLLDDLNIELLIENKIQEDLLMTEKIDLLNFLRVKLENFGIDILTKIAEQTAKKLLYTSTDKYQHMAEKNPKLEDFRKMFNLDIEY
jgi:DNA polymerase-3 subunit gamma/tau